MTRRVPVWIATMGPIGWMPVAPGTWGSAFACVAWWFGLSLAGIPAQIAAILLLTIVGIWSAGSAERDLGHDAHPIVIDEVVGQWIPLLFTNKSISWVVVAFFLFRILDVIKPFGIRDSQKLPGGYGVVIDDLLAGLLAGVIIMIGQKII